MQFGFHQRATSNPYTFSFAMINELARKLDTTSTFLLGNHSAEARIDSLADIMGFLFQMDKGVGLNFHLDVKRPPRDENWQCSLVFDGKDKMADFNADICLFLEEWKGYREDLQDGSITAEKYSDWKDKTLAYYSSTAVGGSSDKSE